MFNLGRRRNQLFLLAGLLFLVFSTFLGIYAVSQRTNLLPKASDTSPISAPQADIKFWMQPNQLASELWYRPGGSSINGHLMDSFNNFSLWSQTESLLQNNSGGFGIYAAELGYVNSSFLQSLKDAKIPVSVEMPGNTQCIDGTDIANAELYGTPIPNRTNFDFFKNTFTIETSGRTDPHNKGWLVDKDGSNIIPDEIVLDERIPGLLPSIDPAVLAKAGGTWEQRKKTATKATCPIHGSATNIQGFEDDYVKYSNVFKLKFSGTVPMPKFSFHWNVNPQSEWWDQACLDANHAKGENYTNTSVLYYLQKTCSNGLKYLSETITKLCNNNVCPYAVYLDADWLYNPQFTISILKKYKSLIENFTLPNGTKPTIKFGVDIVDQCGSDPTCVLNIGPLGMTKAKGTGTSNLLHQQTLINLTNYLINQKVYEPSNPKNIIRIQSWDLKPIEKGSQISETVNGSFAQTTLKIISGFIKELVNFQNTARTLKYVNKYFWTSDTPQYSYTPADQPETYPWWKSINFENRGDWAKENVNWWNVIADKAGGNTGYADVDLQLNTNGQNDFENFSSYRFLRVKWMGSNSTNSTVNLQVFVKSRVSNKFYDLGNVVVNKDVVTESNFDLNKIPDQEKTKIDLIKFRVLNNIIAPGTNDNWERVHMIKISLVK